jgi:hypothetical protein
MRSWQLNKDQCPKLRGGSEMPGASPRACERAFCRKPRQRGLPLGASRYPPGPSARTGEPERVPMGVTFTSATSWLGVLAIEGRPHASSRSSGSAPLANRADKLSPWLFGTREESDMRTFLTSASRVRVLGGWSVRSQRARNLVIRMKTASAQIVLRQHASSSRDA